MAFEIGADEDRRRHLSRLRRSEGIGGLLEDDEEGVPFRIHLHS
jgi:hypothetical protein